MRLQKKRNLYDDGRGGASAAYENRAVRPKQGNAPPRVTMNFEDSGRSGLLFGPNIKYAKTPAAERQTRTTYIRKTVFQKTNLGVLCSFIVK